MQEAEYLIRHGLVWAYLMDDGILSTIVAVTRSSSHVAAITKVYTAPQSRRRGCADHLVAHVCEQLVQRISPLFHQILTVAAPARSCPTSSRQFKAGKSHVVLFVGHTLSAARVYNRVGFIGVGTPKGKHCVQDPNVERWLELGFEGTHIGHW
jgi:predicted GNAT family acetyltransferase